MTNLLESTDNPYCMRSENRIADLVEMENLKNEFEVKKLTKEASKRRLSCGSERGAAPCC